MSVSFAAIWQASEAIMKRLRRYRYMLNELIQQAKKSRKAKVEL
jgi:hypothetical protein